MASSDYVAYGSRLAQGDIVRVPTGTFSTVAEAAPNQDISTGLTLPVPQFIPGKPELVLRVWYTLAVVISPDCAIDKQGAPILAAPIFPLDTLPRNQQDGIRADSYLTAFSLPAAQITLADGSQLPFPTSFVDLSGTSSVSIELFDTRLFSLGPDQLDRLQEKWIRFIALREMSTTGTLTALKGKTITDVQVKKASKKRNAITIVFNDGSEISLYQEPIRNSPDLETVRITDDGRFDRSVVQALALSKLTLRFENDSFSDVEIDSKHAAVNRHVLAAGQTKHVYVDCPGEAGTIEIFSVVDPSQRLLIRVLDSQ